MKILNLACGTKVSPRSEVINIDRSIYLRIKRSLILRIAVPLLLKGERLDHYRALSDNIMVHDLQKRLPFDSDSIEVVYHSHFLEHLDRDKARFFLLETRRVLKPGGVQRIVVPDLEKACSAYIAHISVCDANPEEANNHEAYVAAIIEQSVRREAYGTSQQKSVGRFLEKAFLGDARTRGETHQWMYDRISLTALLVNLGYKNICLQSYNTSLVPNWDRYKLDTDKYGNEHKPDSLYIEALK